MNCYILTGGESRRMGRPKAELTLGGTTFADRIARAAGEVFDSVIEVSRSGGLLPRVIHDRAPSFSRAAIRGVLAALEHAGIEGAWIVSADLPLVTPAFFRYALERHLASATELTVPVWEDRWQMLCAGYRASMLPRVAARIEAGDLSLHPLAAESTVTVLEESELRREFGEDLLWNVNTPADYDDLRRRYE